MDPLSSAALFVVISAAWFAVLYQVVRRAVSAGIRDARKPLEADRCERKS